MVNGSPQMWLWLKVNGFNGRYATCPLYYGIWPDGLWCI